MVLTIDIAIEVKKRGRGVGHENLRSREGFTGFDLMINH